MKNIISIIKHKSDVITGKCGDLNVISDLERELNLSFSEEYKQYLMNFSIAAFDGVELTGITSVQRLNVRSVTEKQKDMISVPDDFYVLEEANIDGIVIWQDSKGVVYKTYPGCGKPKPIFQSFSDYLESL